VVDTKVNDNNQQTINNDQSAGCPALGVYMMNMAKVSVSLSKPTFFLFMIFFSYVGSAQTAMPPRFFGNYIDAEHSITLHTTKVSKTKDVHSNSEIYFVDDSMSSQESQERYFCVADGSSGQEDTLRYYSPAPSSGFAVSYKCAVQVGDSDFLVYIGLDAGKQKYTGLLVVLKDGKVFRSKLKPM